MTTQPLLPPTPFISALLAHADFQRGLIEAHECFAECYEEAPLSEDEMIEEVEMNVSRQITERSRMLCRLYSCEPSSYFYNLGFVIGTINKGLTYTPSTVR